MLIKENSKNTGWEGWYGELYEDTDRLPQNELEQLLVTKSLETKKTIGVVANTKKRYSLLIAVYTPKGYATTPHFESARVMRIMGDPIK